MGDILIRDVPSDLNQRIRKIAKSQNLSLNQTLLQLIKTALNMTKEQKEKEERDRKAFRRLEVIRERIAEKYGRQEDSAKIIREFRDTRNA